MNPNEHYPGPRCSCTDCLARWPDPFAGTQTPIPRRTHRFMAAWTGAGLPLKQLNQLAYRGYTADDAGAVVIWLQDRARGYACIHPEWRSIRLDSLHFSCLSCNEIVEESC